MQGGFHPNWGIQDEGTVLVVGQNAAKALSIASYGYVLEKGRLVVKGSREEIV